MIAIVVNINRKSVKQFGPFFQNLSMFSIEVGAIAGAGAASRCGSCSCSTKMLLFLASPAPRDAFYVYIA
jgi:hypothetical protein